MAWGDILSYVAVGNPVSQALIYSTSAVLKASGLTQKQVQNPVLPPPKPITMWDITNKSYHFVRLAGLSGSTAVIMGAYGKHHLAKIPDHKDQMEAKAVFDTANRFHFLHSFALLAMPLVRRPSLTGYLMALGSVLFCGPMYYRAFTGDKTFIRIATLGGFCLIAAWASLII